LWVRDFHQALCHSVSPNSLLYNTLYIAPGIVVWQRGGPSSANSISSIHECLTRFVQVRSGSWSDRGSLMPQRGSVYIRPGETESARFMAYGFMECGFILVQIQFLTLDAVDSSAGLYSFPEAVTTGITGMYHFLSQPRSLDRHFVKAIWGNHCLSPTPLFASKTSWYFMITSKHIQTEFFPCVSVVKWVKCWQVHWVAADSTRSTVESNRARNARCQGAARWSAPPHFETPRADPKITSNPTTTTTTTTTTRRSIQMNPNESKWGILYN
jgi:hypothetical protein